ncbi:DNA-binding protein, partial [Xenorhabdus sp. GDc328]
KILPETNELATALEIVQKLGAFINDKYAQHNAAFLEILEAFAIELEQHYG